MGEEAKTLSLGDVGKSEESIYTGTDQSCAGVTKLHIIRLGGTTPKLGVGEPKRQLQKQSLVFFESRGELNGCET